jgi:hypothetical protein
VVAVLFGNVTSPQKGVALAQLLPWLKTEPVDKTSIAAKKNKILFMFNGVKFSMKRGVKF